MQTDKLWQVYTTTHFRWLEPVPAWTSFAVITACNPRGRLTPDPVNQTRQQVFINRLDEMLIEHRLIRAGNQDFSYFEPSLAIKTDMQQAQLLSQDMEQNAFFWVEDDLLQLIPVLLEGYAEKTIGSFSSRVVENDN